jgi:hypothetical protein
MTITKMRYVASCINASFKKEVAMNLSLGHVIREENNLLLRYTMIYKGPHRQRK